MRDISSRKGTGRNFSNAGLGGGGASENRNTDPRILGVQSDGRGPKRGEKQIIIWRWKGSISSLNKKYGKMEEMD